jgi:predicted HicB family RNase H-like nuclease
MNKPEKIFTFRISTDLLEAAHVLANDQDLSLAQLMRRILAEAVKKAAVGEGSV